MGGSLAVRLALLIALGAPLRDELPFRFDPKRGRCVDAEGRPGWNVPSRDGRQECADYRGRVLTYFQAHGDVRGANFEGAQFLYLNTLEGADLTGARLRNANLDMAELRNANLQGADLTGAHLEPCPPPHVGGACLMGARYDAATKLPFSRREAQARGMVFVK
jgi:hypothetical protein